jgi:hypothetical protein
LRGKGQSRATRLAVPGVVGTPQEGTQGGKQGCTENPIP